MTLPLWDEDQPIQILQSKESLENGHLQGVLVTEEKPKAFGRFGLDTKSQPLVVPDTDYSEEQWQAFVEVSVLKKSLLQRMLGLFRR